MAGRTPWRPGGQGGAGAPQRVVVLDDGSPDRLDDELDVAVRLPQPWDAARLHVLLALARPTLILLKASLDNLDAQLTALCWAHRLDVLVLARPSYGLLGSARLKLCGGLPWLRLRCPRRGDALVKRVVDVVLVMLSLPVAVPLLALAAALVCWDGPPLYCQRRVGRRGRLFRLMKIRTMRPEGECDTGPVLAGVADPRVTRVGRVLRQYRIDELPQLWNVLCGHMSLVGPRPERPEFVHQFRDLPLYELRHQVRPGLTGIAQLTGGYRASVEDKLRCDLLYLGCRSSWLDVRLLARTAGDLLRGFPRG